MGFSYHSTLIIIWIVSMTKAAQAYCPATCNCFYQNHFYVTSCIGRGLTFFPNGTFENKTNYLYVVNNTMKSVPVGMFEKIKNLLGLYFAGNHLNTLPSGLFQNNKFLMTLHLERNQLKSLPIGIFDHNEIIFFMYLNKNQLTSLPAGIFRNNRQLYLLDLSINELKSLPDGLFDAHQNLAYVQLFSNRLISLPAGIFRNNPKLLGLSMSNNSLKSLPNGLFDNNTLLSEFYLEINQVTSLPARLFANNEKLVILTLAANQLKSLAAGFFDSNKILTTLNLNWNRIESLPEGIFENNQRLQKLYLLSNRLISLPNGVFRNNQQLTTIDLTSNQISFLRSDVLRNNGQLAYLTLDDMKLASLPSGIFDNNRKLIKISLSKNQLKSLPAGQFDNNEQLEIVYLASNQLRELPPRIFRNNKKLRRIELNYNPLKLFPSEITGLPNLGTLTLVACSLDYIPDGAFRGFPMLDSVNLNSNHLEVLPEGLLANNIYLTSLFISNNQLRSLPEEVFNNSKFLTFLYLRGNKLSTLPEKIFHNNPRLSMVILTANQLSFLPSKLFKNNYNLETLYLDHNQLKSLPNGLLDSNKQLINLVIQDNVLTDIPDRVIGNTTALKTLMLHHNSITSRTLSRTLLMNLPSLFALFASYNNIQYIQEYSFSKSSSLSHILLNNNQLKYITRGTFYGASRLKTLFLMANPIEYIADGAFSSNPMMKTLYVLQTNIKSVNVKWFNPLFVYTTATVIQIYTTENPEASISVTTDVVLGYNSSGFQCISRGGGNLCAPCLSGSYVKFFVFLGYICTDCPAGGYYQDTIAVSDRRSSYGNGCKLCDNGTFVRIAPGRRKEDCKPCPEGTNSGAFAGFRACPCQDGFYRLDRFDKCYPCPDPGVTCFNESMTLKAGYYWQWISKSEKDYYINFTDNLQVFDDSYDRDLVQFNGSFPKHYQCPRSESCLGGLDAECAEGYTGPLCAVCDKRHYQLVANCFKCPSIPWLIFQICAVFVLVTTIIFVIFKGEKRKAGAKRSLTDIILARLKIIISFYQISSGTLDAFSYVQWPSALTKMSEYANFIQLNILQIASLHCFNSRLKMDAYADLVITCSMTAGVILVALAYYHLKRLHLKNKSSGKSAIQHELDATKEACYRNVFLFIFVTYPQTCSKIFQMLPASCHKICQDNSQQQCTSYLKADYSITCFTEKYNKYVILAYAALIYPFAVPLLTVAVLWKYHYRRTLVKAEGELETETTRNVEGEQLAMSAVTRAHRNMGTSRKGHNDAIKTRGEHLEVIPEEQEAIADHNVSAEVASIKNIQRRISENPHTSDNNQNDINSKSESSRVSTASIIAGMSFIFENYAENCWFWETIEMTRKLLLTSSLALIGAEGRTSLGIASMLSGCYAILHAHFMPIPDKFEHALQLTSLLVTFANTCIGMMLKIDQGALLDADAKIMDSLIITVLLVTANVMVTALVVIKYLVAVGQMIYYLVNNPHCSLECCLSVMLTLDEVQSEARGMGDDSAWKMNTQLSQGNDFEVPGIQDVAGDFGFTTVEMANKDDNKDKDKRLKEENKQENNKYDDEA